MRAPSALPSLGARTPLEERRRRSASPSITADVVVTETGDCVRVRRLEQRRDAPNEPNRPSHAANRSDTRGRATPQIGRDPRVRLVRVSPSRSAVRPARRRTDGPAPVRLGLQRTPRRSYRMPGHRAKCGSGRGSSRTFGFAAATAHTPSSPRKQRQVRPLSRNATAARNAPQSTTKGQRPGRSTLSLKASIATSAHGIIQRTTEACAPRRTPQLPPSPS